MNESGAREIDLRDWCQWCLGAKVIHSPIYVTGEGSCPVCKGEGKVYSKTDIILEKRDK
jgi:hypothetical protein